jgi:bifunctional DNA-binding transcriptional regulator/antitoxin component of YhaV-PrlF toxin-antitoxin module
MTTTLIIDESEQINLPDALKRLFGVKSGLRLRAEVTADSIELVKEVPVVTETVRTPTGRLILAPTGIKMDVAAAVRAERDELPNPAPGR